MAAAADPASFMRQIAQGSARDSLGFLVWPAVELGSLSTRPWTIQRDVAFGGATKLAWRCVW